MKKVKITISVNSIYFSFSTTKVIENINETSYIETGNLLFEYDYLIKNNKLMSSFIKDIIKDTNINTLKIKNIELVPIVLKIIKNIPNIKNLYILDNRTVDVNTFLTIVDNKYLEFVNCFNMPSVMFNYINKRKKIVIETRNEYNCSSDFTSDNKLNKYSIIYYRKSITINNELTDDNLRDFEIFLMVNKALQTIHLKEYSLHNISIINALLKKYKKRRIRIYIYQTDDNKDEIFNDFNELKKLKKENVKLVIIYDKDFIFKNLLKQINISVLKVSTIVVIFSLLIILGITKHTASMEDAATDEIINDINNITQDYDYENEDELYIDGEYGMDEFDDTQMVLEERKSKIKNAYQIKYDQIFTKLLEINQNTIGWLTVKNTDVNYPVVQYSDNDYYLTHSFDNKQNSRGWVFADYRNHFDNFDDNTIIYGHNLKSGYMFGTLQKTLNDNWYNNNDNRTIIFNTLNNNYSWQIFSIYTIEKNNDYLVANFANKNNFTNYVTLSKQRSIIDFGIDVKYGDKILTLSTCYKDSNHRLIIQAKLIK